MLRSIHRSLQLAAGATATTTAAATAPAAAADGDAGFRELFTKHDYQIPMRDGPRAARCTATARILEFGPARVHIRIHAPCTHCHDQAVSASIRWRWLFPVVQV